MKGKCQPIEDFEASSVVLFAALAAGHVAPASLRLVVSQHAADRAANPGPGPAHNRCATGSGAAPRPVSEAPLNTRARPDRRRTAVSGTAAIVVEQLESGRMNGFVPFDRRRSA